MRQVRWSAALAVQAGSRMLLAQTQNSDGGLTPEQRVAFMVISVGLVIMAGLMSGLTLGLMSMDLVELEVLKRSGTPKEQMYSSAIMPIVSNQHFLLVTLLLCNACAMEALPLFLDRLADPLTAILISVTAVLVFGEVLPQAVCSRYGLAIGYYCAWLVRVLMALTSPISWPIGKLLDFLLGVEHRALFRRGQLKALVDIHGAEEGLGGNLTEDEIKVICGALDLTNKTARKSMTPVNKVFMLPADARLNQSTMRAILASGHSRIPVYTSGDRSTIIGLILVKELLQYKTHQEVPVSDVRMRSLPRLPADTPMYDMLKLFQTGRSHMVVLTDTPATARAAAEAAAAAARTAAEAAAAEAASSEDSRSSGSSPLASMLRGKGRKQRRQFQSALLQPAEEQQRLLDGNSSSSNPSDAAAAGSGGGAWIASSDGPNSSAAAAAEAGGLLYPEQQMPGFGIVTHPPQPFLFEQSQQQSAAGNGDYGSGANPLSQLVREQELVSGSPSGSFDGFVRFDGSARRQAAEKAAGGRTVQFSSADELLGNGDGQQQQQQDGQGEQQQHRGSNSSSGGGSAGGPEGVGRQRSSRSPHARSFSGPLPNLFASSASLLGPVEGAAEGVAVPIGIITIEDVIEELMQAEIVDETDLYVDNYQTITVNAAALAQSLPAQLRNALAMPARPAGPAAGAARVTVRKLIKQRSSSALGMAGASAAAPGAAAPAAVLRGATSGGPAAGGGSGTSSGGMAAAVSAGLAAAASAGLAAAASVSVGIGEQGRSGSVDRQPLLHKG